MNSYEHMYYAWVPISVCGW